jgi:hypothetical protein
MNASCVQLISSDEEFHELLHSAGLGHFYYIGSESGYHYFASDSFLSPTRYYKYPSNKYFLKRTLPKTKDKKDWLPYLIDGKKKTEEFSYPK